MRLGLHTVICCCIFTTVLPLVKGATGDPNSSLKRFRLKVDLRNSSVTANEQFPDLHFGPKQGGHEKVLSPPSSFELNRRPKRTPSSGCALVTCLYHELVDRLLHMNNHQAKEHAPEKKMGLNGYGRRRRRSFLDVTQIALQTGRQRWSTEAGRQV
ncbi:uncharacterized protein admb [Embiotoca jacksoni]|uniref:uncharacterized protein admb n=1 Tax=Embiotoca jacksoni TaxID=100190 RepID=UPI003704945A